MSQPSNYGVDPRQLQAYREQLCEELGSAVAAIKFASAFKEPAILQGIVNCLTPQHQMLLRCFEEVGERANRSKAR